MAFPFEINKFIIDLLATEDDALFSSIKACSLVSRSLLLHTREHIFKVVMLEPRDNPERPAYTPSRFVRLISQSPEIAQYVRTLDYTVGTPKLDSDIKGLAAALDSLTRLKSLKLRMDSLYCHMYWDHMPFPETILRLMHLPTLTHLRLYDISSFPLSTLTLCTGLKFLELGDLENPRIGEIIELYQEQPPRLETFVLTPYNEPKLLKKLCIARRTDGKPLIDISGLKKLSLDVFTVSVEDILEFFRTCTQLVDVYLVSCNFDLKFADMFRPSIQTLQHIHVELDLCQDDEDPLARLADEFALLVGNNAFESIKISIVICPPTNIDTRDDEWTALDRVFTQSESGWAKLQRLSLYIILMGANSEDQVEELVEPLRGLPETHLTGLAASNKFVFDFNFSTKAFN